MKKHSKATGEHSPSLPRQVEWVLVRAGLPGWGCYAMRLLVGGVKSTTTLSSQVRPDNSASKGSYCAHNLWVETLFSHIKYERFFLGLVLCMWHHWKILQWSYTKNLNKMHWSFIPGRESCLVIYFECFICSIYCTETMLFCHRNGQRRTQA